MSSVSGSIPTEKLVHIDEEKIRGHVDEVVRSSVEATLNGLLDAEADQLCGAVRSVMSDRRGPHRWSGRQLRPQTSDESGRSHIKSSSASVAAVRDSDN